MFLWRLNLRRSLLEESTPSSVPSQDLPFLPWGRRVSIWPVPSLQLSHPFFVILSASDLGLGEEAECPGPCPAVTRALRVCAAGPPSPPRPSTSDWTMEQLRSAFHSSLQFSIELKRNHSHGAGPVFL